MNEPAGPVVSEHHIVERGTATRARVEIEMSAGEGRMALAAVSVNDQRRAAVEGPRGLLRRVVLEAFFSEAGDRQARTVDAAAGQVVLNGSRTPLAKRLVVLGASLRAGVSLDVKTKRGRVVQRLEGNRQRTQRIGPQYGLVDIELDIGQHAQCGDFDRQRRGG